MWWHMVGGRGTCTVRNAAPEIISVARCSRNTKWLLTGQAAPKIQLVSLYWCKTTIKYYCRYKHDVYNSIWRPQPLASVQSCAYKPAVTSSALFSQTKCWIRFEHSYSVFVSSQTHLFCFWFTMLRVCSHLGIAVLSLHSISIPSSLKSEQTSCSPRWKLPAVLCPLCLLYLFICVCLHTT